jgi:hypothetical protein
MRLIQYRSKSGDSRVGVVMEDGAQVAAVRNTSSTYALAIDAIAAGRSLATQIDQRGTDAGESLVAIRSEGRLLTPLAHPDPAHCHVTGTGLTHLGSAAARDQMHQKLGAAEATLTDSMKIFKAGVEGGRCADGQPGVQPEWFYKGDGSIVAAPDTALPSPDFALDGGEEPEIVGLYVIGMDRLPYRLGFALGNEFSDHVTERQNYLYLAHSKLRPCAIGPEMLLGELPRSLHGTSRILRDGKTLWEKPFLTGEDNMCHDIANLEYHHFKYAQFLRPGDVHVHFFGTATVSIADGIQTQEGDVFEISIPEFGTPLSNRLGKRVTEIRAGQVRAL